MRIYGPNGTAAARAPRPRHAARPAATSASPKARPRPPPAAPLALRTIGGIDALIALQGIEDPTERRRHAVKRGRRALDALDELKIGLLGGNLTPGTLQKLESVAAHLKDGSGDAGLDGVLAEIELRVEVEIAKLAPCTSPQIGRQGFAASHAGAEPSSRRDSRHYSLIVDHERPLYKRAARGGALAACQRARVLACRRK